MVRGGEGVMVGGGEGVVRRDWNLDRMGVRLSLAPIPVPFSTLWYRVRTVHVELVHMYRYHNPSFPHQLVQYACKSGH